MSEPTVSVDFFTIGMELMGGLALFLYGMELMTEYMKVVAGSRMKGLLAKLTTNRFTAVFAGAFVTAIIQSSSVTTVLVVGFISAGLMNLSQSIGIILGADIGTTVTAQIIAFKVTKYSMLLVATGFFMVFAFKKEKIRQYGYMMLGLGLVFFGMHLMSDAARPLRTYEPFISLMSGMDNALLGILVSGLFTAIIQSSSATTGVIIVLASQGFISIEAGIALVFGANIGTCVTAFLAAMGKPVEAKRAAWVHILFKIAGVLIWLPFIPQLAALVSTISPAHPELEGAARMAAETPRQIANAHTIFNVSLTLIFIWFTEPLARLVIRMFPNKAVQEDGEEGIAKPHYLNAILLQTPSVALEIVRLELGRLGAAANHMVREALGPVSQGTQEELDALRDMDNEVDGIHAGVINYLRQLSRENLSQEQSVQLNQYISAANYLENIGDMVESNLYEAGQERLARDLEISDSTQRVIKQLHEKVAWAVQRTVEALVAQDVRIAAEVTDAKGIISKMAEVAEEHLSERLAVDQPNRLHTFRLESEIVENLRRIYYFAKRVAKLVQDHATEERAAS